MQLSLHLFALLSVTPFSYSLSSLIQVQFICLFCINFCIICLQVGVLATHAALPPQLYWHSLLPSTPIPSSLSQLLHPSSTTGLSLSHNTHRHTHTHNIILLLHVIFIQLFSMFNLYCHASTYSQFYKLFHIKTL